MRVIKYSVDGARNGIWRHLFRIFWDIVWDCSYHLINIGHLTKGSAQRCYGVQTTAGDTIIECIDRTQYQCIPKSVKQANDNLRHIQTIVFFSLLFTLFLTLQLWCDCCNSVAERISLVGDCISKAFLDKWR